MEVDQVNGVGTLIVPGDHVDVILSVWVDQLAIKNAGGHEVALATSRSAARQDVTTKMVIQNRKVLVTLLPPAEASRGGGRKAGASATPAPEPTADTVTNTGRHMIVVVEVLPEEAEVIRWAQRAENADPQNYITLGLALRSDKDNDAAARDHAGHHLPAARRPNYGVLPPDPRAIIPATSPG